MKRAFERLHGAVYSRMDAAAHAALKSRRDSLPTWCVVYAVLLPTSKLTTRRLTADSITYFRLSLAAPTALSISHGHTLLPCGLIVTNALLDYADGALARFDNNTPSNWGGYLDANADKAFSIIVWTSLFAVNPQDIVVQGLLGAHIVVEGYSAHARSRDYHVGKSESHIKASAVGKTKQVVTQMGTACVAAHISSIGVLGLGLGLPLAIASAYSRVASDCVVVAQRPGESLDELCVRVAKVDVPASVRLLEPITDEDRARILERLASGGVTVGAHPTTRYTE